jgi:hypothetical protein
MHLPDEGFVVCVEYTGEIKPFNLTVTERTPKLLLSVAQFLQLAY